MVDNEGTNTNTNGSRSRVGVGLKGERVVSARGPVPTSGHGFSEGLGWLRRWGETGNRAGKGDHFTGREGRMGQAAKEGGQASARGGGKGKEIRGLKSDRRGGVGPEREGGPSPRTKEEWVTKKDNPWDTTDKAWLKARLEAPRKGRMARMCVLEQHIKVWEEAWEKRYL
jgi:hypothetical protein